jgi:hypothetical protein
MLRAWPAALHKSARPGYRANAPARIFGPQHALIKRLHCSRSPHMVCRCTIVNLLRQTRVVHIRLRGWQRTLRLPSPPCSSEQQAGQHRSLKVVVPRPIVAGFCVVRSFWTAQDALHVELEGSQRKDGCCGQGLRVQSSFRCWSSPL